MKYVKGIEQSSNPPAYNKGHLDMVLTSVIRQRLYKRTEKKHAQLESKG